MRKGKLLDNMLVRMAERDLAGAKSMPVDPLTKEQKEGCTCGAKYIHGKKCELFKSG